MFDLFLICVLICFMFLSRVLPSLPWPSPTSPSSSFQCPWWQGSTSLRPASSNLDRLNGAQAGDCDTAWNSSNKMGKEKEKDQDGSSSVRNLPPKVTDNAHMIYKHVVSVTMDPWAGLCDKQNRLTSPKLQNWNIFNVMFFQSNDPQLCNGPGRKLLAIKDASSDALRKTLDFVALRYWSGHWLVTGLSPDLWVSFWSQSCALSRSLSLSLPGLSLSRFGVGLYQQPARERDIWYSSCIYFYLLILLAAFKLGHQPH